MRSLSLVVSVVLLAACNSGVIQAVLDQRIEEVGLVQYKPVLPGKCVVILVHGFNVQDEQQFQPLAEKLYQRGANVFEFKYEAEFVGSDNNNEVVDEFVSAVKTLKDVFQLEEIKILGHSLGGLVTWRALIEDRENGLPTVSDLDLDVKYVAIATAWGGFDLAKYNKLDPTESAPIGAMLAPNSPWLQVPGRLGSRVCFTPLQTIETDAKQFGDDDDDVVDLPEQRNDEITDQADDGKRRAMLGHSGVFRATDANGNRSVPPETLALILHKFNMETMSEDALLRAQIMGLGFELCTEQGIEGIPDGPCAIFVPDAPAEDAKKREQQERDQKQLLASLKCRGYAVFVYTDDYDDDGDGLADLIFDEEDEERHAGADLARGVKGLLARTGKNEATLFLDGRGQLLGRWATSSHPKTPSSDTLAQGGGPSIRTVDLGETTPDASSFSGSQGSNVSRENLGRTNFENSLDQGDFNKIQAYVRVEWPLSVDGEVVIGGFQDVKLSRLGGVQAVGRNANNSYDHAEFAPPASFTLDGKLATSDCPGLVLGRTYGQLPDKKAAVKEVGLNLTGDENAFVGALNRAVDNQPTVHSSLSVTAGQQAQNHTKCYDHGAKNESLTQQQVDDAFNNSFYPCGLSENGLTLCVGSDPVPAGEFIVAFNVLDDPVPLDDPECSYQYGFVFDSDDNPANNYQPIPEFFNDFFKNTDLWFQANYSPADGWSMRVTDAAADPGGSIASRARILIVDNVIALIVPASEFAGTSPAYRVTAFKHKGDFGLNPPFDWNGDVEPPVADGLADFD